MNQCVDRSALISAHLDFARRLARERVGRGLSLQDLEQEAMVGLCVAADRYECTRGEFAPFAARWIKHYISAALDAAVIVKLPVRLERASRKAHRARADLVRSGVRMPSEEQVAERAGLAVEVTREALRIAPSDVPVEQYGVLGPHDGSLEDLEHDQVWDAISLCDQMQRAVLILLFGLDGQPARTLGQVARELGLTRARVSELRDQAAAVIARELARNGFVGRRWLRAAAG